MSLMNAEYQIHKPVWEMVKPRIDYRLESSEALARAIQPADAFADPLDWAPAMIDPTVLAHGHVELSSPLSEW